MAAEQDQRAGEQTGRRRRRLSPFLAVPITLGVFFWLLARAIIYANEHGLMPR